MNEARSIQRITASPVVPGFAWGVTYIGARFALEMDLPAPARVAIAVAPVAPFLLTLVGAVRGVRAMDELHRRVHLEALVIAFPLTLLFIMTLGLLELAVGLPMDDWSYRHVLPFLVIFYAFGLWRAWKRYL
jgi:hypothetical protein